NRRLKLDNDRLKLENVFYRNQLTTAEHARALTLFQAQSPSKTVAARVIGNSTVATAKAVFIDRGSTSGIEKGMAAVTPDGIVGKVVAVYPLVSQVLLVTDPTFKVGVESQKGHIHGVLNCGNGKCSVEQIQNEEKVATGEWFFTSGEDRIFPKGFPVGTAVSVQPGEGMKDIKLNLSGAPEGTEEVLVVLKGIHQAIPAAPVVEESAERMLPPPPDAEAGAAPAAKPQTEADKIVQKYDFIGKEEGHVYGAIGSTVPNFNVKPAGAPTPADQAQTTSQAPPQASAPPARIPPAVLGTHANSKFPAPNIAAPAEKPATSAGPVLPLGAPRHKAATPPPASAPKPPPQP
ncbi:MAG: rod shape-determining protein MreC, partial [Bryobacteraceae bacterium]